MKLCMISDTHEKHRQLKIPNCDVLIHAGDISFRGDLEVLKDFNAWLEELQIDGIINEAIVIAGNHDLTLEDIPDAARPCLSDCIYLEDEAVSVYDGSDKEWKIYGSPWSKRFFDWGFNADEPDLAKHLVKAPFDTEILITHGPPLGFLDINREGEHCGSKALYDFIMDRQPKLVVCGHIHEGYGLAFIENTLVVNASTCTREYKPVNLPIVIDI